MIERYYLGDPNATWKLHCFCCYTNVSKINTEIKTNDNIFPSESVPTFLYKCTRCKSAWYCSEKCQRQNYMDHKKNCIEIRDLVVRSEKEADELKSLHLYDGEEENIFQTKVGFFWGLVDPREYCRSMFALSQVYKKIARDHDLLPLWQKALDIELELLRLAFSDNLGVRFAAPFTLIEMNRENEAINLMDFYSTDSYIQDCRAPVPAPAKDVWVYGNVHRKYDYDFRVIGNKYPQLDFLVALLVIKFREYAIIKDTTQMLCDIFARALQEKSLCLQIAEFNSGQSSTLLLDIHQLIDIIVKENKTVLKAVLNPAPIKSLPFPFSYSAGSVEQARIIIDECCRLFARIPYAHNVLNECLDSDLSYVAQYREQYQAM